MTNPRRIKHHYYGNCVDWPKTELNDLIQIVDNSWPITRRTFCKHISSIERRELESELGYAPNCRSGLTMSRDWHVSYHRTKIRRHWVYFFTWSGIEYIFVPHNYRGRVNA